MAVDRFFNFLNNFPDSPVYRDPLIDKYIRLVDLFAVSEA